VFGVRTQLTHAMTIIDRYLGRPAQIVIGLWLFMFLVTRIKYGYAGYVAAQVKLPADLLCKKDCDDKPHWRRSNPEVCEELDSVSMWTPYSKGIDAAMEHIYLCGVMPCSDVLDSATHSMGWFGAYFVVGGVLATICGIFLYVILTRLLSHAGSLDAAAAAASPQLLNEPDRSRRKIVSVSNHRFPMITQRGEWPETD